MMGFALTFSVSLCLAAAVSASGLGEEDAARCRLTSESLRKLSSFSSDIWVSTSTGPALSRTGARCVDADLSHLSVAIPIKEAFLDHLKQQIPRHPRGFWVRHKAFTDSPCRKQRGGGEAATCAWVAACVPVGCLGDETLLAKTAARVVWHRLVGDRKEGSMPGLHFDPAEVDIIRMFSKVLVPEVPKVELHKDSLKGAISGGIDVEIVTCTDKPALAFALQGSLPPSLPLRFLRPPQEDWPFSFFATERHLLAYVTYLVDNGFGDRFVVYVDAWDTDWMGCERNLTKALEALGTPMFFGGEYARYPAGLPGYQKSVVQYRGENLQPCRQSLEAVAGLDEEPIEEHLPCLGTVIHKHKLEHAIYLNGGVYGGRAWALEKALRSLLGKQASLRASNPADPVTGFNVHGKTHQYLWSQYMLDNPEMVSVDFGGAIVVNMYSHHVNPRLFHVDIARGQVWSKVFQRPICILHGNGYGEGDDVMRLMRAARSLRFNPEVIAGVPLDLLSVFLGASLRLERQRQDRFVVDTSICFEGAKALGETPFHSYRARVGQVSVMVPDGDFALTDLSFFFARPGPFIQGEPGRFEVVAKFPVPFNKERRNPSPRPVVNMTEFRYHHSFELGEFRLTVQPGDCLGWRCVGPCELGNLGIPADKAPRGIWRGPGRDFEVGDVLELPNWSPFMHVAGVVGTIFGLNLLDDQHRR